MNWKPTHKLTLESQVFFVKLLSTGEAFTEFEWRAFLPAQWYRCSNGVWLLNGVEENQVFVENLINH